MLIDGLTATCVLKNSAHVSSGALWSTWKRCEKTAFSSLHGGNGGDAGEGAGSEGGGRLGGGDEGGGGNGGGRLGGGADGGGNGEGGGDMGGRSTENTARHSGSAHALQSALQRHFIDGENDNPMALSSD